MTIGETQRLINQGMMLCGNPRCETLVLGSEYCPRCEHFHKLFHEPIQPYSKPSVVVVYVLLAAALTFMAGCFFAVEKWL